MADEDEVEASRAPLIEHLTELRDRLIKALIALAVCVIVCFIFATELFDLLARPLNVALSERGLEDVRGPAYRVVGSPMVAAGIGACGRTPPPGPSSSAAPTRQSTAMGR